MAKTDSPIIFHEPGTLFTGFDLKSVGTAADPITGELLEIRKKVEKVLSSAEAATRRLKAIQETCLHPIVMNDPDGPTHQCMICGYRRLRRF